MHHRQVYRRLKDSAVLSQRFIIQSIKTLRGSSYELTLFQPTAPDSIPKLTIPGSEFEQMKAKSGGPIVVRIQSTDFSADPLIEKKNLPFEVSNLHSFTVTTRVSNMIEEWSEPKDLRLWWQPYSYFDTEFQNVGNDTQMILPLYERFIRHADMSIGDFVVMIVTIPQHEDTSSLPS